VSASQASEATPIRVAAGGIRWLTTSTGLSLAALVVISGALHVLLALRNPAPWIVPDELVYSELAKSIGSGGAPGVRGVESFGYGLLYPTVISPAWWLFHNVTTAYTAARLVNALCLATAIVFVYLLARRFVSKRSALVVSVLSAFAPVMLYSGALLTEVVVFPTFLLALLGVAASLEDPSGRNQIMALLALGLAFSAKSSAIALVAAYLVGIALKVQLDRGQERRTSGLAAYRITWFVAVGAVVVLLLATVLSGRSPVAVFGVYADVLTNVSLLRIPEWFAYHLADLTLYVAVAPAVASGVMVVAGLRGRADAHVRRFSLVTLPAIVLSSCLAASVSSKPRLNGTPIADPRIYERSIVFLFPLLLIGMALWLEHGRPRPRAVFWSSAAAAVLLVAALPLSDLRINADFQAMALVPWLVFGAASVWPFAGVAFVLLTLLCMRGSSLTLWAVTAFTFVITTLCVAGSFAAASRDAREASDGFTRDWIDRAVGSGAQVAVVWREPEGSEFVDPAPRHRAVWINEFFNRSIDSVYSLGARMPYALPDVPAHVVGGVLVRADGVPIREEYVLARCGAGVEAPIVTADEKAGVALFLTDGVVRIGSNARRACAASR
jgi:hypothetical protein